MSKNLSYPCIPTLRLLANARVGNPYPSSIKRKFKEYWVPAFAGMSGVFLSACGSQTAEVASVSETPKVISEASTPLLPMRKSLALEDIDFNGYSKGLAKFTGLKEGQSRGEAVDNVRLYFAPEDGNTIISTSQSTFERDDGAVLLFSASGLPDDAVKAEEIYLILSGAKGEQTLAAFGSRIKCHRGENTTQWTTELCP